MTEVRLAACRPEPLGSYLKALGVLRLVGAQRDASTKGRWDGDTFVLTTPLDPEGVVRFFVDDYRPTPIVAPWNGRGGFRSDVNRDSERILRFFASSTDPRLAPFRAAVEAAQAVFDTATGNGWDPKKDKDLWVETCRAVLPDEALLWLDAVVVLTTDGPGYPPLLGGAGGVLGSMDLSSNFLQRLAEVLCLPSGSKGRRTSPERSEAWLKAALFGTEAPSLVRASIGQFDPGGAGGVNSSPLGDADSLVNPWDYVLLLEGALLFASGSARRLDVDGHGTAAMPFMVGASPIGYASGTAGESSRGEVWAPLWSRPVGAAELAHLIGEGRSQWRGHQSRTGLDMARAVATLGVDRGIGSFARHAFVERHGQSNLAVPVGRFHVQARVEVPLLGHLDRWLDGVRRASDHPAAVTRALRRVDSAMFRAAEHGGHRRLQEVLVAVAEVEAAVGRSGGFREKGRIRPIQVQGLPANEWLPRLDDGSPELRLAASLASQHDDDGQCLRWLLRPVRAHPHHRGLEWSEAPASVAGFGVQPFAAVLAQALVRRAITGGQASPSDDRPSSDSHGGPELVGVQTAFRWRVASPLADVVAFVSDDLDDDRIGSLLAGLLLLDWRQRVEVGQWFQHRAAPGVAPPAWALLAPFFHGRPIEVDGQAVALLPQATWPPRLACGRLEPVIEEAVRRLRIAALDPAVTDSRVIAATAPTGTRLAAALLCPLSAGGSASLLRRTVPEPID